MSFLRDKIGRDVHVPDLPFEKVKPSRLNFSKAQR